MLYIVMLSLYTHSSISELFYEINFRSNLYYNMTELLFIRYKFDSILIYLCIPRTNWRCLSSTTMRSSGLITPSYPPRLESFSCRSVFFYSYGSWFYLWIFPLMLWQFEQGPATKALPPSSLVTTFFGGFF